MDLTVTRHTLTDRATLGDLALNGAYFCRTLEDVVRQDPDPTTPANEAKVYGATAIPAGTYTVVMRFSPHFGRVMPRLLNVPGFEGILIHSGNTDADTLGCILVGERFDGDTIARGTSRIAYGRLYDAMVAAVQAGEPITITIRDAFAEAAHG